MLFNTIFHGIILVLAFFIVTVYALDGFQVFYMAIGTLIAANSIFRIFKGMKHLRLRKDQAV